MGLSGVAGLEQGDGSNIDDNDVRGSVATGGSIRGRQPWSLPQYINHKQQAGPTNSFQEEWASTRHNQTAPQPLN